MSASNYTCHGQFDHETRTTVSLMVRPGFDPLDLKMKLDFKYMCYDSESIESLTFYFHDRITNESIVIPSKIQS